MDNLPDHSARGHSDLGASGAERWIHCRGSVALIKRIRQLLDAMGIPEEDDPDYRREGTAMHEASAHALETGLDAWELVGMTFNQTVIDTEMGDAIQVYLDIVRRTMDHAKEFWIEAGFSAAAHPDMWGTMDFGAYLPKGEPSIQPGTVTNRSFVDVTDLKGGVGIIVDPDDNPQLKYYAFLLIENHPEWEDGLPVRLRICQPRGFAEERTREWWTTVGEIKAWVQAELVPAMLRTQMDETLDAGPWCRFCPAKLICPLLTGLFRAAYTSNPKELVNLDNTRLGLNYQQLEGVTFYIKALKDETLRRLNKGLEVEGVKLVPKKANRVMTAEGQELAKERFGDDAMNPPSLKTPAQLEVVSPAAALFVKEHSYTPNTGVTVALASNPKPAVIIKPAAEVWAGVAEKLVDGSGQTG